MMNFLIENQKLEKNMMSHPKLRTTKSVLSGMSVDQPDDNMSKEDVEQSVEQLEKNISTYQNAVAGMKANLRKLQGGADGAMETGTIDSVQLPILNKLMVSSSGADFSTNIEEL